MPTLTPRIDSIESPTSQTDIIATKMGLKVYSHGTTYNGGISPTVTAGAGFANVSCVFIPYQMQDSSWRMRFNLQFTITSTTVADVLVNGILFSNISPAIASANNQNTISYVCRTQAATNSLVIRSSIADTNFSASGDVPLSSKPTWAY